MIRITKTTMLYPILGAYLMIAGFITFYTANLQRHQKPAVIFDLDGVLFKTSKGAAFKKLGGMSVLAYALSGKKPEGLQDIAFDILYKLRHEDPAKFDKKLWPTYNGKPLPTIMYEWQQGTRKYQDIINEVSPFIEKLDKEGYFANEREKTLIKNIIAIMFDPATRMDITKPLKEGVQILNWCKKAGYDVYVLSNMDTPSMELLQKEYPEIFSQFKGIVYSGEIQQIKPYHQIYTYLLTKYQLDPAYCFFLDNQEENITTAEQLGINCMLCTSKSMKSLCKELRSKQRHA